MKRKNEIFSCCLVLVIVGVTLGLFFHLHSRINREKLTPHIDPEQPMVALTFDDGPNPTYTPPLLDLLYRYQAPSTFFILGEKISSNRWLLQEMVCSGHELGNHTYSHTDLTTLTPQQIEYEIDKTENALKKNLTKLHHAVCAAPLRALQPIGGRHSGATPYFVGHRYHGLGFCFG